MTEIVLDLPVPPSTNVARRINWGRRKDVADWTRLADFDMLKLPQAQRCPIKGPVSIAVIVIGRERK